MRPLAILFALIAAVSLSIAARRFVRSNITRWSLSPFAPGTLTIAFALGAFLSVFAPVARFTGHFDYGLAAAALAGALAWWATRRLELEPVPRARRSTERWVIAIVVGFTILYGNLSFRYQMHDEHAVFGHKSMVEQFRRGVSPLYYPSSPDEEARYHYGFDILAGVFTRALDLNSDLAIDLVCIALALLMCWAAAAVAADNDAERSAPLAAVAIHLGAGLAFVLLAGVDGRHPRCLTQYHHPSCGVELFPTQLLNVFQHPVSLGVPLLLAAVLLLPRIAGVKNADAPWSKRWLVTAAATVLVLGGLAVGQFVYYALGGLAALAAFPFWRKARVVRPALGLVAVLAVSFGLAALIGGMLAPNPSIDPNLVRPLKTLGFPPNEPVTGILWHHTVNLGLGFLFLPWFMYDAVRRRAPAVLMLTAFGIGGILVAHLFQYTRSWDIVKFPSAASFALSMVFVLVVDRVLAQRKTILTACGRGIGAVLLCGSGAVGAVFILFPLEGDLRLYDVGRWQGDAVVRQCIDWFRSHDYKNEDIIYAQPNIARELSVFGGLSVIAQDTDLYYMGVRNDVLNRMKRESRKLQMSLDPRAIAELGVHYLVFSEQEITNLGAAAKQAISDETRFEKLVTFPSDYPGADRSIWRVKSAQR